MNLPPHILLLDDDLDFCSIVIDQLQVNNEFIVSHFGKIRDANENIVPSQIDLIIVNSVVLQLEIDKFVDFLRKDQKHRPVILLQKNSDNYKETHSINSCVLKYIFC